VATSLLPQPASTPVEIHVGCARLHPAAIEARGALIDLDGERAYEITDVDAMPPFLMSVASDSDHWMFVSSTGGLTAGRRSPDQALFPYTTDDRLHDSADHTGPTTILRVDTGDGRVQLWQPLSSRQAGLHRICRRLAKSLHGNRLRFTEVNQDLALEFSYEWTTSHRFGFVRRACLRNTGDRPVEVELVDGLLNLMPAGLGRRFQEQFSTLADGYKDSEIDPRSGLGIFRLSSIPVDAAEPSEALLATTVWSAGLPRPRYLLSARQLDHFRRGGAVAGESRLRGQRGAYLVGAQLSLPPGGRHEFYLVADVHQDASAVIASGRLLASGQALAVLLGELPEGSRRLVSLVAAADGLQSTADELHTARHFASVLFNCQRGGIPAQGYTIDRDDFDRFLRASSSRVHGRHQAFLGRLPGRLLRGQLLGAAREQGDPDLERLAEEYLPLTFGRRHGDPSRPWNDFQIAVRDAAGQPVLDYQGNWRDLFQNWEALAPSYPSLIPGMIFKFLDASTADGHNPYRVTRAGFEWEVQDPHDAWSFIGYWGDHQVIYLLKLLELSARFQPGTLRALLSRRLFTFADVPYRIRDFDALVADPQRTIDFDERAHGRAEERAARLGSEGKLLLDEAGEPVRVSLIEKLLVLVLARLANLVPGAGLWLNTQRPEWNDANNALVGNGASVVTLAYLRRFLAFARDLLVGAGPACEVSAELAAVFEQMQAALQAHLPATGVPVTDAGRRVLLEALGRPWSEHRRQLYRNGVSGVMVALRRDDVVGLIETALLHVDHTLRANRRPDGLYHAYNLIRLGADGIGLRRLPEMLEGQVAVLSSGALELDEALALLDTLRASDLYRADQDSYLLYPDRQLPAFLDRNRIAPEAARAVPWLARQLERGDGGTPPVLMRDEDGWFHFHHGLRNARQLAAVLDAQADPPSASSRQQLLDLYERVFDHHSFTGRSGTFYKYEGLGCIYWHMVSKLRLAVQEVWQAGVRAGAPAEQLARLRQHYLQIREGLGVHKPPALYGAIPTDPYSHTPGFAGVQQPGMTGQVKEDILCRLTEVGLVVRQGCLTVERALAIGDEFLTTPARFRFRDVHDQEGELSVPAGALAITFCQVPAIIHRDGPARLEITTSDGSSRTIQGLALDVATSAQIFGRTGAIRRLDAWLGLPAP
jgi:hypothetical protein